MKQSEYMMAIFERLGKDQAIICQDCGAESKIGHAIINHDNDKSANLRTFAQIDGVK